MAQFTNEIISAICVKGAMGNLLTLPLNHSQEM
jgi:hypothetical protein